MRRNRSLIFTFPPPVSTMQESMYCLYSILVLGSYLDITRKYVLFVFYPGARKLSRYYKKVCIVCILSWCSEAISILQESMYCLYSVLVLGSYLDITRKNVLFVFCHGARKLSRYYKKVCIVCILSWCSEAISILQESMYCLYSVLVLGSYLDITRKYVLFVFCPGARKLSRYYKKVCIVCILSWCSEAISILQESMYCLYSVLVLGSYLDITRKYVLFVFCPGARKLSRYYKKVCIVCILSWCSEAISILQESMYCLYSVLVLGSYLDITRKYVLFVFCPGARKLSRYYKKVCIVCILSWCSEAISILQESMYCLYSVLVLGSYLDITRKYVLFVFCPGARKLSRYYKKVCIVCILSWCSEAISILQESMYCLYSVLVLGSYLDITRKYVLFVFCPGARKLSRYYKKVCIVCILSWCSEAISILQESMYCLYSVLVLGSYLDITRKYVLFVFCPGARKLSRYYKKVCIVCILSWCSEAISILQESMYCLYSVLVLGSYLDIA